MATIPKGKAITLLEKYQRGELKGRHAEFIVIDDPIETEESRFRSRLKRKVREKYGDDE